MKVAVCEDTDWLLSEEAYSIYAPCMYHPTCEDYRTQMEGFLQRKKFEEAGFEIIRAEEVFNPIRFYNVGAFVWFAHIIEWVFPGFSVEKCFDKLLEMQEVIDKNGFVEGTIHRYLIVAKKKG